MNRGDVVWEPRSDAFASSPIGRYLGFLRDTSGMEFTTYDDLHRWSVADVSGFWTSIWDHYDIRSHSEFQPGLAEARMPGAVWFPGASLNYAERVLDGSRNGLAIVEHSQTRGRSSVTWRELRDSVATVRTALVRSGVGIGDTVAVYCPAITEALIVYLACASVGAVYASCAIEFGVAAVVSRLQQIRPKLLFAVDGYRFGKVAVDRSSELGEVLHTVRGMKAVVIPYLDERCDMPSGGVPWAEFIDVQADPLQFTPVPFDHPLVVVFTSGTTGAPKPIVHSHGGVVIEHLKSLGLQLGLGSGSRFFWYTTAGWMMWNYLISGLLVGASIVLFDGDPGHPDPGVLWRIAAEEEITVFGVSPRFLQLTRRTVGSLDDTDLAALRVVGSTGAPLAMEEYEWFYGATDLDAALVSASGGTDVLSALVCWAPILPIYAGEISAAALGVEVDVVDRCGRALRGVEGELVIRQPMPSMPVGFWNDPTGERLHHTYFAQMPGLWTQGDWATMTDRRTFVLSGRSDATLNRRGIRMGTAELYAVVEELPGIQDSVAVCLEATDVHDDLLILLVVLEEGATLDHDMDAGLRREIRRRLSPRHVPDRIVPVSEVPRTSSGKKAELAVKRLLLGKDAAQGRDGAPSITRRVAAGLHDLIDELTS